MSDELRKEINEARKGQVQKDYNKKTSEKIRQKASKIVLDYEKKANEQLITEWEKAHGTYLYP